MDSLIVKGMACLAVAVDVVTGLIIGVGVAEAVARTVRLQVVPSRRQGLGGEEMIRLRLGKWLALALEFALASDIVRTAVAPSWDEIGKLGAIMALRTALNYFLEREFEQAERVPAEVARAVLARDSGLRFSRELR
jgi:uncharacterized membrane protein